MSPGPCHRLRCGHLPASVLPQEILDSILVVPRLPELGDEAIGRESLHFEARFIGRAREVAAELATFARISRRYHEAVQSELRSLVILDSSRMVDHTSRRFARRKGVAAAVRHLYVGDGSDPVDRSYVVGGLVKACTGLITFVSRPNNILDKPLPPSCRSLAVNDTSRQLLEPVRSLDCLFARRWPNQIALALASRCRTLGVHVIALLADVPAGARLAATVLVAEQTDDPGVAPMMAVAMPVIAASFPDLRSLRLVKLLDFDMSDALIAALPRELSSLALTWSQHATRSHVAAAMTRIDQAISSNTMPSQLEYIRLTVPKRREMTPEPWVEGAAEEAAAARAAEDGLLNEAVARLGGTARRRGITVDIFEIAAHLDEFWRLATYGPPVSV